MFVKTVLVATSVVAFAGGATAQSGKKSSSGNSSPKVVVQAPSCTGLSFSGPQMDCTCEPGSMTGSVWGSGPYTSDSSFCAAGRHAGIIDETGGVIRLVERPGQDSYSGSTSFGITSSDWGSYGSSFAVEYIDDGSVVAKPPKQSTTLEVCGSFPSGQKEYACFCAPGDASGSVWGNDPYTGDSSICAAAVHSGYIDDEGGDVYVLGLHGLSTYFGDENNGVTSGDWGTYGESFVFDRNR